jgi:hypothetical protein
MRRVTLHALIVSTNNITAPFLFRQWIHTNKQHRFWQHFWTPMWIQQKHMVFWRKEDRQIQEPFPEPLNIVNKSQSSTAVHKLKPVDPNSWKIRMVVAAAMLAATWNKLILSAELCVGAKVSLFYYKALNVKGFCSSIIIDTIIWNMYSFHWQPVMLIV